MAHQPERLPSSPAVPGQNPSPPGRSALPDWLRSWWPALLWAAVIFMFSTDHFSAQHTENAIESVLHYLFPALSRRQLVHYHFLIRKAAHFTEYFVLCLLLYRGIRGVRSGWRWSWSVSALVIAACYSALDEIHQAFVRSRTASPYDSLLDSAGAAFAVLILFFWFRLRRARKPRHVA